MARGWKCPRCGTSNDDVGITCKRCGSSRGAVVIPGAHDAPPAVPPEAQGPTAGPAGPEAISTTAPSQPLWRRIPLAWVLFAALALFGLVSSWVSSADRSESGEVTKSGDLAIDELRPGDCFNFKDPDAEEIDDVAARPCSEEHEYETFFVGSMPAGAFPEAAGFEAYVVATCEPAFATYVGTPFEESRLGYTWIEPTGSAWSEGARSIQCMLYDPQTPRLTGSLKGSNR